MICALSPWAGAERRVADHGLWEHDALGGVSFATFHGPAFEQPDLSLVGDATVVLGDCYNLHVRASETDNGQDACLVPPIAAPLFADDAHLTLNMSVCQSRLAGFHAHDPQPAALAAMQCFDECRVQTRNPPSARRPTVDRDALQIANCSQQCFAFCVRPAAVACSSSCPLSNFSCYADCHHETTSCAVPMALRDTRFFRADPNTPVCADTHDAYWQCVSDCSEECHTNLRDSNRTVFDDVHDWYHATCTPPLDRSAMVSSSCVIDCESNCSSSCRERVSAVLGPELGLGPALRNCTTNCTVGCVETCFSPEANAKYLAGCQSPATYNCTDECFGNVCAIQLTFCTVYDEYGRLRAVDANCTWEQTLNVSYTEIWANQSVDSQLANPDSPLSLHLSINSSVLTCYDECTNTSRGAGLFFHNAPLAIGLNCSTRCYEHSCLDSCMANCSAAELLERLPPCVPGPNCLSPTNCSIAEVGRNCSAAKAFEAVMINITAVTQNVTAWIPPWTQEVCEDLVGMSINTLHSCLQRCPAWCAFACPLPSNHTTLLVGGSLHNDTSGVCLQQCHFDCAQNCSLSMFDAVEAVWCVPPPEPLSRCEPPSNCTEDCASECLDPTMLLATDPGCEEYMQSKLQDGSNITVVSIPMTFNVSAAPACSRNQSNCSLEYIYYNVTEFERDLLVSEGCVRRCASRCVARCFDRYCVTRLEVPINETAVCLPRCLRRFYADAAAVNVPVSAEAYVFNSSQCQLSCLADCAVRHSANCSALCEHLIDPPLWQSCVSLCYANASASCSRDCVYWCTANLTLAYGVATSHETSGDYITSAELVAIVHEEIHGREGSNASESCYTNCTHHCAVRCFEMIVAAGWCAEEEVQAVNERDARGLGPLNPVSVAELFNNCTLRRAASCLDECQSGCHMQCSNLTDAVPYGIIQAREHAALHSTYVDLCEATCRVQIYGRNITEQERCLAYTPAYRADCLTNCTNEARSFCANPNSTIDVAVQCNSTCAHLYVEGIEVDGTNATSEASTGNAAEAAAEPNAEYSDCMGMCSGNFTTEPTYLCDGGIARVVALERAIAYYAEASAGRGQQGITPAEQLEVDRLNAAVPMGELCQLVDIGCVANNTGDCEAQCAEQVAFFHELCVYRHIVQHNATFDYNVSSCYHPNGWRVGTEKWRYYAVLNSSSPEAQPDFHRSRLWSYDDIADHTILNCSCHFHNETFDPEFVAAVIEYGMRPHRSHFVSTCMCLYNETERTPQHCVHNASSNSQSIFDWAFANRSFAYEDSDMVARTREDLASCGQPCVQHCSRDCGVFFVEHVEPRTNNGSMFLPRYNTTFRFTDYPQSLTDWNVSNERGGHSVTRGHWRSSPECFDPCMRACAVSNCSRGCDASCDGTGWPDYNNATAQAFGCFWNSTYEEGRPLCQQFCGCHKQCASGCVAALTTMNTSTEMMARFPVCVANCSVACEVEHYERCANNSAVLAAARRPRYVNETAVCLNSIWPTCALHCLGVSVRNATVNNSLFSAHKLPVELLALNATAGFDPEANEGYRCKLEYCDMTASGGVTPSGLPCNQSSLQTGERRLHDPISGNTTRIPILVNVSLVSIDSCYENRSSTCLSTCSDFGHGVCFPKIDPFDLCVQSCVANLTFVDAPYRFEHSLSVCKKRLRLTPSQSNRRGAAWYRHKQYVREGFVTSFAFRLEHPSRRCSDISHPSYRTQPESLNMICLGRGGDGFAFVLQDAGVTSFDAQCVHAAVETCVRSVADVCTHECRSVCPSRATTQHASCAYVCLGGVSSPVRSMDARTDRTVSAPLTAVAEACDQPVALCISACDGREGELYSGAAMEPGGCLRDCLDDGAREYCEERCPLVDEDVDFTCVEACTSQRLASTFACFRSCNTSCTSQALLERAACEDECLGTDALLPSGEPVGRCRATALAHPVHDIALCLTRCTHTDQECLQRCAEDPDDALPICVGACPQNHTLCVAECLGNRRRLGRRCLLPRVLQCNHTSVALGGGTSGVGYASLRNTLAVKFDTWHNSERSDPWVSHVAVHSGGEDTGAPTDSSAALAWAIDHADFADGKYHEVLIEYAPTHHADDVNNLETTPLNPGIAARMTSAQRGNMRYVGALRVLLDGKIVLRMPLNLEALLKLDRGRAYLGFTGATGSAYQEHSIHAWRFNESLRGALVPANEQCRLRVPSLWHAGEFDGAPFLPANTALACAPGVMDATSPEGAMHSLHCRQDSAGIVYCLDPNMRNLAPTVGDPLPDVSVLVGESVDLILHNAFRDEQSDGRITSIHLSYSLAFLPHNGEPDEGIAWVSFDSMTRRLHGTPTQPGTWRAMVTASDPGFREGADASMEVVVSFLLHVRAPPVDPTVADFWA